MSGFYTEADYDTIMFTAPMLTEILTVLSMKKN